MRFRRTCTEPPLPRILSFYTVGRNSCIFPSSQIRLYHGKNGPRRLSEFWAPTGGIARTEREDSHDLLVRAGFVRQAQSGVFHLLPLGLRVQGKLERLVDNYMQRIGASKVSLSTLSSEELWRKSGRLEKGSQELFRLEDRKGAKHLLAPTHEEEITSLVGDIVRSHKDLPLRLYQVSRKYRDELRPRQGLLRGREFLMKDLYTFDIDREAALATYQAVLKVYNAIFSELKIPFLVAEADSGSIGGDLSHEYHLPSEHGEDLIIGCSACRYTVNEELTGDQAFLANQLETDPATINADGDISFWRGVTHDRSTLIEVAYPKTISWADHLGNHKKRKAIISTIKVKHLVPSLDLSVDLSSGDQFLERSSYVSSSDRSHSRSLLRINDYRVSDRQIGDSTTAALPQMLSSLCMDTRLDLLRPENGDTCPKCLKGTIKVTKAIEIGHTFHLGTRYSEPLGLSISPKPAHNDDPNSNASITTRQGKTPLQMGCHGIGISRMIAAVASTLADDKGLNWPSQMAPFQAVIIPKKEHEHHAYIVFEELIGSDRYVVENDPNIFDAIIDDRDKGFAWKLNDADLIGYPIIVIIGKGWAEDRTCEVQCRRLEVKENVHVRELRARIGELLAEL